MDRIYGSDGTEYQVSDRFCHVLRTLPKDSIPEAIVLLGILVEELTPVNDNIEEKIRYAKNSIDEPPTVDISSTTVRSILWLLKQVRNSLNKERKLLVGTLIANAELNTPTSGKEDSEGVLSTAENVHTSGVEGLDARERESKDSCEDLDQREDDSTMSNEDSALESINRDLNQVDDSNIYECEFCSNTHSSKEELMTHLVNCSERPAGMTFKCTSCTSVFNSQFALERHVKRSHESGTVVNPTYSCSICEQEFDSRSALLNHTVTHSETESGDHDTDGQSKRQQNSQSEQAIETGLIERNDIGVVDHFDAEKGFGFIKTGTVPEDVFFHISDFVGEPPTGGDRVQYDIDGTENGYTARNVCHSQRDELDDDPFASTRTRWGKSE